MQDVSLKRAALITAVSKYINIFLGIFFSAILSRILTPNDYGIVAIVSVFTAFFIVLSNCGLGIAVIQKKEFTKDDINSIFTFSFYFGFVLMLIFILLAYPISLFFKSKIYFPICLILSISIFFNTINAVPDGLLRKEKKFLLIGIRLVAVSILTYGVTILLALMNFKYYALVIQSVASSILIFLWNLRNVKVNLVKKINWNVLKSIFSYSGYNFLFNFFNYFSRNLDKLIIGKFLGNENLAQYNKAYHFMLYPVQNLTNVITPTLHPILSDYQDNIQVVYEKYVKVVKFLSLIGVIVTAICFICSKEIISILYGSQWADAAVCFKYMSLAIWGQMVGGTTGSLFAALNDTRRHFYITILNTFIIVLALIVGIYDGNIRMIALYVSIALNSHFFTNYYVLIKKTMKKKFFHFFSLLFPDIIMMIILCFFIIPMNRIVFIDNIFFCCFIKSFILCVVYLFCLFIFRQWKYLITFFPKKRNK